MISNELTQLLGEQKQLRDLAQDQKKMLEFGIQYQRWYTRAVKIVEALAPDRLDEFISYYRIDPKRKGLDAGNYTIQDYIKGIVPSENYFDERSFDSSQVTPVRLINQFQILSALQSRLDSVLSDVTGHLLTELEDLELEAAAKLTKINLRAAGALAGVVLERHLQQVARSHNVVIHKKDPTISDLNDSLKDKGAYDLPTWRKIQLLADIRNICSHKKSQEPTEAQVNELISGVNSVIKSIY